jgi:hypothetical protein
MGTYERFVSASIDQWATGKGEAVFGAQDAKSETLAPIVTVFGAGIAGLSAAHELIERGFVVQVVEPTLCPDEEYSVEVGGLARNQFGRVTEDPSILHKAAKKKISEDEFRRHLEAIRRLRAREMRPVQLRFPVPSRIRFFREDKDLLDLNYVDEWKVKNAQKLVAVWDTLETAYRTYVDDLLRVGESVSRLFLVKDLPLDWVCREILYVEIRGHTDGDGEEGENRKLSEEWAHKVCRHLETLNQGDAIPRQHFDYHFLPVGVGSCEPLGDQRDDWNRRRSNRVEFRIVERLVPGEHGYRFVPAFYRHLFDTMRRTPILDEQNRESGQTAYDRLVPTREVGLALEDGRESPVLETRRIRSLEELRRHSELFFGRLGVTPRDLARFQVRLLKFLTSSSERRRREYQQQTWWTFLGGESERGYSQKMAQYLLETPQALVAMNAEETDARSQGNIVSQLTLHYLENQCDQTLNGPTTQVWLRDWKRYLERQGVRFFVGMLGKLHWEKDELVPLTSHDSGWLQPAWTLTSEGRAPEATQAASAMAGGVLIARQTTPTVEIEVLDSDPGDYVVTVADQLYCVTFDDTTGDWQTRTEQLAKDIAKAVNSDPFVEASVDSVNRTRVVVEPGKELTLEIPEGGLEFDESDDPGTWQGHVRTIKREFLVNRLPSDAADTLEKLFEEKDNWDDEHWVYAGRLRAETSASDFDNWLSAKEQLGQKGRELVPQITVVGPNTCTLAPPKWTQKPPPPPENWTPLYPYFFRTRKRGTELSLLVRVRNADGNLTILGEPLNEDPEHGYLAHGKGRRAFQPDFYVLALSLEAASKLVWGAEMKNPGGLDGCLAELLHFDRHTSRRSRAGARLPVVRNRTGRPPADYPLRDFSGVQYYFHDQVRIGKGHNYYPDAEWGLSSISQLAHWRERMSPVGPFMGQLSVDIGNFYALAPRRGNGRFRRSAWHSTSVEIVTEVWNQIQQGLERERAGVMTRPDYVHLDQWLRFDDARCTSFRGEAPIVVRGKSSSGKFTIWINGQRFTEEGRQASRTVAQSLKDKINLAPSGGLSARFDPRSTTLIEPRISEEPKKYHPALMIIARATLQELEELKVLENNLSRHFRERGSFMEAIEARLRDLKRRFDEPTTDEAEFLLRVQSTVQPGTALVYVTGGMPGRYMLAIGNEPSFYYVSTSASGTVEQRCKAIRDRLFRQLASCSTLPITVELSNDTGILLSPKRANELPTIKVQSDHQGLSLVFGPMLEVRLDQCQDRLAFDNLADTTIGRNEAAFLINVPGQWEHRPGVRAGGEKASVSDRVVERGLEEAVRYRIANRRWIAAGTYMATTTRLTTMEAANESARHAVNAVLHRLLASAGVDYNAQGRMFADWAETWNPEKYELDELEGLKRLDAKLVEEGLPHMLDVLKVLDTVDAMPMHGKPSHDPIANMLHVLQHAVDEADKNWGFSKEILHGALAQAVERGHDALDPLGVVRGLKGASDELKERVQKAIRDFLKTESPGPS